MDQRSIFAIGILGTAFIYDNYVNWRNKKTITEITALCSQAGEFLVEDQAKIDYLLSLMNKYHVPVDEYDRIVLKNLGIESV